MKPLRVLFTAFVIGMASFAQARSLGADETRRLLDAGTIVTLEKLTALALAKHPGAQVNETNLEEQYGKYLYQVELIDPKGIEWDVELDAVSGQVLKNHQDM
ncbi:MULTISPECIES: PepSY domain-containing protein [unclassified Pseudomonas]|uniref:PepSY domain-containing protein n=1 Tax=unclassified Pseudomonas TaxID=196821 RepID=UPI002AC960D1|nr:MULTISPECIES: PepSY domain-containing protein [unclassified Pseudomonas]MEB0047027.1 PepSY domain-containing protein [Pseudomonas sp. Dout3]MEB0097821.1 PepSY domain-containing protein [Pseudomonas sp. DC1.2]WPX57213.1 PepSY domain-containing protein [Pseudomonas sp. DC1.2]